MGNVFKDSRVLNEKEYKNFLLKYNISKNEIPLRLKNKKKFKDIDIFTIEIPTNLKKEFTEIREIVIRSKLQLPSDMISNHILTHENIQVYLLPFIGREYTRIFYSYEIANVFF
jgi:predicted nucleotidyltransferase